MNETECTAAEALTRVASTSGVNVANVLPRTISISFFDLPQEVRDIIYAHVPYLASIHINQDPSKGLFPPVFSKVCSRMRRESLDVFYGRNLFFIDLRGWKGASLPPTWTPRHIFDHWITAIGDESAARLRKITFFSHSFRFLVRVSHEKPPVLTLKFNASPSSPDLADGVPASYTFASAVRRAEQGLRLLLNEIQNDLLERPATVEDFKKLCSAAETIQPFLCRRMSLGYQGTCLLNDEMPMSAWPQTYTHRMRCDECGYHRITRGQD